MSSPGVVRRTHDDLLKFVRSSLESAKGHKLTRSQIRSAVWRYCSCPQPPKHYTSGLWQLTETLALRSPDIAIGSHVWSLVEENEKCQTPSAQLPYVSFGCLREQFIPIVTQVYSIISKSSTGVTVQQVSQALGLPQKSLFKFIERCVKDMEEITRVATCIGKQKTYLFCIEAPEQTEQPLSEGLLSELNEWYQHMSPTQMWRPSEIADDESIAQLLSSSQAFVIQPYEYPQNFKPKEKDSVTNVQTASREQVILQLLAAHAILPFYFVRVAVQKHESSELPLDHKTAKRLVYRMEQKGLLTLNEIFLKAMRSGKEMSRLYVTRVVATKSVEVTDAAVLKWVHDWKEKLESCFSEEHKATTSTGATSGQKTARAPIKLEKKSSRRRKTKAPTSSLTANKKVNSGRESQAAPPSLPAKRTASSAGSKQKGKRKKGSTSTSVPEPRDVQELTLPPSVPEIFQLYEVKPVSAKEDSSNADRSSRYSSMDASSEGLATTSERELRDEFLSNFMQIIVDTPPEFYSAESSQQILNRFPEDVVCANIEELLQKRILKKRTTDPSEPADKRRFTLRTQQSLSHLKDLHQVPKVWKDASSHRQSMIDLLKASLSAESSSQGPSPMPWQCVPAVVSQGRMLSSLSMLVEKESKLIPNLTMTADGSEDDRERVPRLIDRDPDTVQTLFESIELREFPRGKLLVEPAVVCHLEMEGGNTSTTSSPLHSSPASVDETPDTVYCSTASERKRTQQELHPLPMASTNLDVNHPNVNAAAAQTGQQLEGTGSERFLSKSSQAETSAIFAELDSSELEHKLHENPPEPVPRAKLLSCLEEVCRLFTVDVDLNDCIHAYTEIHKAGCYGCSFAALTVITSSALHS